MKYPLIVIINLLTGFAAFSETTSSIDTIYYDYDGQKTTKENCSYYQRIDFHHRLYHVEKYDSLNVLRMTGTFRSMNPNIREGKFTEYHKNGKVETIGEYIDSKAEGEHLTYYESGRLYYKGTYSEGEKTGVFVYYYDEDGSKLKRNANFRADTLVEGHCYTLEGKDTTYFPSEEMPMFPGGEKGLQNYLVHQLNYPANAKENNIEGQVLVKFTVFKTGKIGNIKVIKSAYPSLDEEAMDAVRMMPRWLPGMREGELVDVWYTLPISFRLE